MTEEKPNVKLTIGLSTNQMDRLEALQEAGGFDGLTDFMIEALRLMEWATDQLGQGRKIAALDSAQLVSVFNEAFPFARHHVR